MSLPLSFQNYEHYFKEVVSFLKEYQWIYNYANVDVLVLDICSKIPKDWVDFLSDQKKLNNIPLGQIEQNQPESLKNFLNQLNKLKSPIEQENMKCEYKFQKNCCLEQKKIHEILSLAPVINDTTKKTRTKFIVDVGSGLGYLCNLLAELYGHKILAIESSEEKIKLSQKQSNKNENVKFFHHFIDENSTDVLSKEINNYFKSSDNICITGLHACADLSVVTLNLFLNLDKVTSMVIMPCCYHRFKRQSRDDNREIFNSFPISDTLKKVFDDFDASTFIRTPLLRLACQQTYSSFVKMSEEQRSEAARNLLYRSVLQKAAHDADRKVSRTKRKSGKTVAASDAFAAYVENLKNTHKLEGARGMKIDDEAFKRRLFDVWTVQKNKMRLIETLSVFQVALQQVCELFLLIDRVVYLRERGVESYVKKITDDAISPRCYALIAFKRG